MSVSNGQMRFGRKLVNYEYDAEIKHDVTKIDNEWTSLYLQLSEGNIEHRFSILCTKPKKDYQTNWRPELSKMKRVFDLLRESNLKNPEIAIFPLGSRKIYPDERKPFPYPIKGEIKREISVSNLLTIGTLFFDRRMKAADKNTISAHVKEFIDVQNPRAAEEIAYTREIHYDMEINVGDFDAQGILDVVRY